MNRLRIFYLVIIFISSLPAIADECEFPGTAGTWHDLALHEFEVDGRDCKVVCPDKAAVGSPWIWRARFWGHEPQADLALLDKGFHVVYMDVAGLFGSPKAVKHWDAFHTFLTSKHGFSKKAALEGMSRGGLIIYNWAIQNPQKVSCIYGDAPVLDFRSWPAGKGRGKGSRGDWIECLDAYGLTEAQAMSYNGGPIRNIESLAAARVPLLHVVGADDMVVPIAENSTLLEKRYRELGGDITVISKPGIGHHPHSLKDPKPIVDFVIANANIDDGQ
jgi:pimeloyl-ACP methyl ester carboxylesterase